MAIGARRVDSVDLTRLQAAEDALVLARENLRAIDLRAYGGDPEVRDGLKQIREAVRATVTDVRHVCSLRWRA